MAPGVMITSGFPCDISQCTMFRNLRPTRPSFVAFDKDITALKFFLSSFKARRGEWSEIKHGQVETVTITFIDDND